MNPDLTKNLHHRYVILLTERDQFIAAANQKLGEYAGRLAELEMLLTPTSNSKDDVAAQLLTLNPESASPNALPEM